MTGKNELKLEVWNLESDAFPDASGIVMVDDNEGCEASHLESPVQESMYHNGIMADNDGT